MFGNHRTALRRLDGVDARLCRGAQRQVELQQAAGNLRQAARILGKLPKIPGTLPKVLLPLPFSSSARVDGRLNLLLGC